MQLPEKAYDLYVLADSAPEIHGDRQDGWCYGLPPGILPEEWPLDPANGYPMQHGFTLMLPKEYLCHGPDIVAISFFSLAFDHNDGGPATNEAVAEAMAATEAPTDPALLPFWQAYQHQHPRLHRMKDILDADYAIILLTQQEFDAPFTRPPALIDSPLLGKVPAPDWLSMGAAAAWNDMNYSPLPQKTDHLGTLAALGGEHATLADDISNRALLPFNRALKLVPRASDPNAGKTPEESWNSDPTGAGYQSFYYWQDGKTGVENYREHDWAKCHQLNHLGGTMRPVQAVPQGIGPFYIGFEEYLGGFNFGGGNAQLDFQNMIFDWACG
ncbi:hypothetical protein FQV27_00490 [Paracoccus aurantiacus]|uniref:DUF1963 domain-containing protein n=1 Tax=Paracoccus aurantiacus TaxID=2599412 RepID=A0A5C6S8I1_9RHOB|nr:hypothetical protein [Paracoccus aurantiacus]TXB70392.1 hypothetical protein FQV27_00490 [Paracoccus aurantiacus]